jgi:hypothetical protein
MITLTTPAQVNSVLGGSTLVGYDHMVLSPITYDTVNQTIAATIRLTSTANPNMQVITGTMFVSAATFTSDTTGKLEVTVEKLDFYRRVALSAAELEAVVGMVQSAQNSVEAGLVGLGVIAGTQSTGV